MRASFIFSSVSVSTEAVASSKIKIGGSFKSVRAMAIRCFSPPESFTPRSPIRVSYPLGRPLTKSSACAAIAAFLICSWLASTLPYKMFSATVPLNKYGSWETMPICSRR